MPTKDEHVSQAEHDRRFWSSLNAPSTAFVDWVVSGMFYEAVHWVEAFLATRQHHSDSHYDRTRALARYQEVATIRNDFFVLKADSENARYRCYRHSSHEIMDLIPKLTAIENHVGSLL